MNTASSPRTEKSVLWSLVVCISLVLLGSLSAFGQQWNPLTA